MELGSSQTADGARTEVRGEGEGEEEEAVVERAAVPVEGEGEEEAVVKRAAVPVERVGQEEKEEEEEEEEEGEGACSDEELDELLNC